MTVELAVVGVGWAGTRHIEAIDELARHAAERGMEPPVRVAMLIDPDAGHLSEVADRHGIERTGASLEEALADLDIDAVSLATPHALHAEAAIQAAQAGKHVAVEKPMAVTVGEADRMIAAAESAGTKLFVTEQVAYGAEVRRLRQIVESGECIGELTFASVTAGFRADDYGYPGRRAWLALPDEGGSGTWLLHGIHTVAAVRAVFGEVKRVYAVETKSQSFSRADIEGTVTCLLEMESGVTVQLVQSCETRYPPDRLGVTIFGTNGTVFSGKSGLTLYSQGTDTPSHEQLPEQALTDYALEFKAFAEWIENDAVPPTTGRHERGSLAVVQAGCESAATGEPVHLPERFGAI